MDLVKRRRDKDLGLMKFPDLMGDVFSRVLGDLGLSPYEEGSWYPPLDIVESPDSVRVQAELPGVKPEEIDISVEGNTLVITGEKKESSEQRERDYYRMERRYGSFRRYVTLPAEVKADKVEAKYTDGILTITLPKSEQTKARHITVKAA